MESLANDRLMSNPPTNVETEKTYLSYLMMEGRDVCYNNPTVYCEDLPLGGRGNVASWFLSPRRHAVELVVVVSVWSLVLFLVSLLPKARSFTKRRGKDTKPTAIVSFTALANVLILVAYKWFSSTVGQMYYIVMPCNMQWFMHLTIAILPMPTRFRDAMMQLMMCYQALVWTVFFTGGEDKRGSKPRSVVVSYVANTSSFVSYLQSRYEGLELASRGDVVLAQPRDSCAVSVLLHCFVQDKRHARRSQFRRRSDLPMHDDSESMRNIRHLLLCHRNTPLLRLPSQPELRERKERSDEFRWRAYETSTSGTPPSTTQHNLFFATRFARHR